MTTTASHTSAPTAPPSGARPPAATDGHREPGGRRLRALVVGGGQSCEHDVSLASAASVAGALDPGRYDVVTATIAPDGRWSDASGPLGPTPATSLARALEIADGCDVVLPVVHGPRGEDGALAGLLDLAGVPYVGSGIRAGALAMDKWSTKLVASALGIGVATGTVVTSATADDLPSLPVVVKPVAAGSSHGVTLVRDHEQLHDALAAALALDDRALVEEVVVGREVDVAVLATADGARVVSPTLEIGVPAGGLFDTTVKYDGSAQLTIPAALPESTREQVEAAALAMFDALGCAGVARVDFFVTDAGLVLNEVNTMPGMTEQSQVPRMFAAGGLPYPALLDALVDSALVDSALAAARGRVR